MRRCQFLCTLAPLALAACAATTSLIDQQNDLDALTVDAATLPAVGSVSERFLSYNIEMLELTGGRFWKPYGSKAELSDSMYQYRPPIDLTNARLRSLAKALAPAYVRYSGTWANTTVLESGETKPHSAHAGYDAVLTRKQWLSAIRFAQASDAEVIISMPTSPGSRKPNGTWDSTDAERLFDFTQSIGGQIAAAEFANEPNLIGGTKPPANYSAADYRRDFGIFVRWMRRRSPSTLVLGPGAFELGQGSSFPSFMRILPTTEVAASGSERPDVVSFHFYGSLSKRCKGAIDIDPRADTWLSKIDGAIAATRKVQGVIDPSAPIWLTETGEAACGGNPRAKTFDDTFRYVDQLARAARQGVQVVAHNTLAASDYALLDENTFAPRPSYWAAALWKKLMGSTVLNTDSIVDRKGLRLYGHCLPKVRGGVTILAINTNLNSTRAIAITKRSEIFSLTQKAGQPSQILLNDNLLRLGVKDEIPPLIGREQHRKILVPASSINFIKLPDAGNPACL